MKAIDYTKEEVGKIIKSTKVKHVWNFEWSRKGHCLLLKVSKLSGKIEIVLDDKILAKNNLSFGALFPYHFEIEGSGFELRQNDGRFDIFHGQVSFNELKNDPSKENGQQERQPPSEEISTGNQLIPKLGLQPRTENLARPLKIKIFDSGARLTRMPSNKGRFKFNEENVELNTTPPQRLPFRPEPKEPDSRVVQNLINLHRQSTGKSFPDIPAHDKYAQDFFSNGFFQPQAYPFPNHADSHPSLTPRDERVSLPTYFHNPNFAPTDERVSLPAYFNLTPRGDRTFLPQYNHFHDLTPREGGTHLPPYNNYFSANPHGQGTPHLPEISGGYEKRGPHFLETDFAQDVPNKGALYARLYNHNHRH